VRGSESGADQSIEKRKREGIRDHNRSVVERGVQDADLFGIEDDRMGVISGSWCVV
jgi:hypothetical protein